MKSQKYPKCVIFLKCQVSKDFKHDILDCQIHKYSIYDKMKYPTNAIFLNSWWLKDVKNDNPKSSYPRFTVDFCTVPPGLL